MNRFSTVLLVLAFAVSGGCGDRADGPPAIEVDRTVCAHCGMFVSEPVYAAAYRTPDGTGHVFDDIACLRASARAEPEREALVLWFRDAEDGAWIPGSDAMFVRSPHLQTPMGGGLMAYRDPAAARRAASTTGGEVVPSVAELLWGGKEGGL